MAAQLFLRRSISLLRSQLTEQEISFLPIPAIMQFGRSIPSPATSQPSPARSQVPDTAGTVMPQHPPSFPLRRAWLSMRVEIYTSQIRKTTAFEKSNYSAKTSQRSQETAAKASQEMEQRRSRPSSINRGVSRLP